MSLSFAIETKRFYSIAPTNIEIYKPKSHVDLKFCKTSNFEVLYLMKLKIDENYYLVGSFKILDYIMSHENKKSDSR